VDNKINNKGIGLPIVLGITSFLIASIMILITSVVFQMKIIDSDYQLKEEYINAQQVIEAVDNILINNEDFSSTYLADLSTYLDVTISSYSASTWQVSRTISNDRTVTSYLSSLSDSISLYDNLFMYDGLESGFSLNPLITPEALLSEHLNQFLDDKFSISYPNNFLDISEITAYIDGLTSVGGSYIKISPTVLSSQSSPTVNGHWYVNGSLTLADYKSLVIPDGYILFINGSLTLKKGAGIYGNVVVNGNVSLASKKTNGTIRGTIFASGFVSTDENLILGTSTRPAFVFAEKSITYQTNISGYGYMLTDRFTVNSQRTNINIIGGVYSPIISNLDSIEIQNNTSLNLNNLYNYAVPTNLYSTQTGSGSAYIYTKPR